MKGFHIVFLISIQLELIQGQNSGRTLWQCGAGGCRRCRTDIGRCNPQLPAYSLLRNCRYDCDEETATTRLTVIQRQSADHIRYFCSPEQQCQACDPTAGNCPTAALYDTEGDCLLFCSRGEPEPPAPVQYFCSRAQCYSCGGNGRACPDGASLHDNLEICRVTCRQDVSERFQCISGQCYPCGPELGNCVQDVAMFTSNEECSNRCVNAPEVRWYCGNNGCSDCIGRACPQTTYDTEAQCQRSGCGQRKCGKNEAFRACGGCDRTCKTRYGNLACSEQCSPGCGCLDGYVRSTRYGMPCIPARQCEEAPQVSYCEDKHVKCKTWARSGECKNNPTWMKVHCRKACNQCRRVIFVIQRSLPLTTSKCFDTEKKCSEWAMKGECSKNPIWMKQNCKRSCNTCQHRKVQRRPSSRCVDGNKKCRKWATRNECRKNPIWMRKNCKKSCNSC